MRGHEGSDDNGNLNCLVRREAQRAVVIDLTGGVRVGDRDNARSQHKGNTENSQDSRPGKPCPPLCGHETHVISDYSVKSTSTAKARHASPLLDASKKPQPTSLPVS